MRSFPTFVIQTSSNYLRLSVQSFEHFCLNKLLWGPEGSGSAICATIDLNPLNFEVDITYGKIPVEHAVFFYKGLPLDLLGCICCEASSENGEHSSVGELSMKNGGGRKMCRSLDLIWDSLRAHNGVFCVCILCLYFVFVYFVLYFFSCFLCVVFCVLFFVFVFCFCILCLYFVSVLGFCILCLYLVFVFCVGILCVSLIIIVFLYFVIYMLCLYFMF